MRADVTAANNVLARVPDIADFVSGFAILLKPDGVSTFEFPHLLTMIDGDPVRHDLSRALLIHVATARSSAIFGACGLKVFDVEEISTHGGSLRVFAQKAEGNAHRDGQAARARAKEEAFGLKEMATYERFGTRIEGVCEEFRTFLRQAKAEGKTVAAYGAAAKGNTFLNVCGVNTNDIAFVVDRSDIKQGRLLPGSHIPVYAPSHIEGRQAWTI